MRQSTLFSSHTPHLPLTRTHSHTPFSFLSTFFLIILYYLLLFFLQGEFFIVCNDADVFKTVYDGDCSEEVSTALSDGDDVVSLVQLVVENGALNLVPSDIYGTIGESGEGTCCLNLVYCSLLWIAAGGTFCLRV